MAFLTPKAGSKILGIAAYLSQHNTTQGAQSYQEVLLWLNKTLGEDHLDTLVLMGGDLKAMPSPSNSFHNQTLENFCTTTTL
jgi:hypothetical protein